MRGLFIISRTIGLFKIDPIPPKGPALGVEPGAVVDVFVCNPEVEEADEGVDSRDAVVGVFLITM